MGWLLFGSCAMLLNMMVYYCDGNYKLAMLNAAGFGFLFNTLLKLYCGL